MAQQYSQLEFGVPDYQEQSFDANAYPVSAGGQLLAPAVGGALRLADRFPVLAGFILSMRARGANMTPQKLMVLVRRFGPAALVSMGFVAVEVLQDLFAWNASGRRHRRMNPTNVKALRRSLRRLDGFARLSARVMSHRSAFKRGGRSRSRCVTCKKSPCRC